MNQRLTSGERMSGERCVGRVEVANPSGLATVPSAALVMLAQRFSSEIRIRTVGGDADAKNVLEAMMLAAEEGTLLEFHAQGEDAEESVRALVFLIEVGFRGL